MDIHYKKDSRISHWTNINIDHDLELKSISFFENKCSFIEDKRTKRPLEFILDIFPVAFTKINPHEDVLIMETYSNEENHDKLKKMQHMMRLESSKKNTCIKWLEKLDNWFINQYKKEEKNGITVNLKFLIVNKKLSKLNGQPTEDFVYINILDYVYKYNNRKKEKYQDEWTEFERNIFHEEIAKDIISKNTITIYDASGEKINDIGIHYAPLETGDEVVVKVKPKICPIGIKLEPLWIQIVKRKNNNNKERSHTQYDNNNGPINYENVINNSYIIKRQK